MSKANARPLTAPERALAAFSARTVPHPPKRAPGARCGTCRYGGEAKEPPGAMWCLQYPFPRLVWEHHWCGRWGAHG